MFVVFLVVTILVLVYTVVVYFLNMGENFDMLHHVQRLRENVLDAGLRAEEVEGSFGVFSAAVAAVGDRPIGVAVVEAKDGKLVYSNNAKSSSGISFDWVLREAYATECLSLSQRGGGSLSVVVDAASHVNDVATVWVVASDRRGGDQGWFLFVLSEFDE